MKNNSGRSYQLLSVIATPKLAENAADMLSTDSLPVLYRIHAQGTASSEIMDMLGFGSVDKCLLISVVPKDRGEQILLKLHSELKLDTVNSGIAFTISLTGASNLILKMLESSLASHENVEINGGSFVMNEKYSLIVAVVNRGFGENVMTVARAAGARGGTILHSRSIENEEITANWGLSGQEEKEIVMILMKAEGKLEIMRAVAENCGMHSEAKGTVFSLPIDSVMGL